LHYFIEFDSFVGRLCHSDWRLTYNVHKILSFSYLLPKLTDAAVAHGLFVTAKLLVTVLKQF